MGWVELSRVWYGLALSEYLFIKLKGGLYGMAEVCALLSAF